MTNIWSFIMQTAEVSLAAVLVLLVRYILKNSISTILRYCLWLILVVRIFIPADMFYRYMIPKLYVGLEAIKSIAEAGLGSRYTMQYSTVRVLYPYPWITSSPASITDWIFVIYAAGIPIFFISYILLNIRKLRGSKPVYIVQFIFWSILRSLNWCNPFLQFIFIIISRDLDCVYIKEKQEPKIPVQDILLLYICIFIVILIPSITGISSSGLYDVESGTWGRERALASARISRCTTAAGAIDTYAKAIIYSNTVYLAAVTPMDMQQQLIDGSIDEFTYDMSRVNQQYYILNLKEEKDGTYSALLVFATGVLFNDNGELLSSTDSQGNTKYLSGYYVLAITVEKQDG